MERSIGERGGGVLTSALNSQRCWLGGLAPPSAARVLVVHIMAGAAAALSCCCAWPRPRRHQQRHSFCCRAADGAACARAAVARRACDLRLASGWASHAWLVCLDQSWSVLENNKQICEYTYAWSVAYHVCMWHQLLSWSTRLSVELSMFHSFGTAPDHIRR